MKCMLFDNVLIKPLGSKFKNVIVADEQASRPNKGKVVKAGPGDHYGYPNFVETVVKPGDVVLFSKDRAMEVELKKEKYYILRERDILSVLDEDELD